jgi:hypothetical protein
MECKVTHTTAKAGRCHHSLSVRGFQPITSDWTHLYATLSGKERESRPKLVCDGQPCDGPTGREALGISTAERVFEISDYRQGLEQSGNDTACFLATAKQSQGSTGIGPVALMRSIIMNVILTIGYDRYLTSIEDAAKIMALLGKAKRVDMVYGYEAEGTIDRFVVKDDVACSISAVSHPLADA